MSPSSLSVAAGSISPSNQSRVTFPPHYSQHSKRKLRNSVHLLMHVYIAVFRLALLSLEMRRRLNRTDLFIGCPHTVIYGATIAGLKPVSIAVSVLIQTILVNKTMLRNRLRTSPDLRAGRPAQHVRGSLNWHLDATI